MIGGHRYTRRCRHCWHVDHFALPPLNKRVVYLDQFAISNMMMALNPNMKAHKAGRVDPKWRDLFHLTHRLVKFQLLACPESDFHRHESTLAPFAPQLKRMYELLSGGASFHNAGYIQQLQLHLSLEDWLQGRGDGSLRTDIHEIVFSDFNTWQDRLIISVNTKLPEDWIDESRRQREEVSTEIAAVFERWRAERKSYDETYREEVRGFGKGLVKAYLLHLSRFVRVAKGLEEPTLDLIGSSTVHTTLHLLDVLREAKVSEEQVWPKLLEYLVSDALEKVPFVRLTAMLYAAIARKAVAGQKRPPSKGMTSDVEMVATLLPYCDAMLVDNEIAGYLREEPIASEVARYGTTIFSPRTLDAMVDYLKDIEVGASPEHMEKVREVYGPDWGEPFDTVYDS